MMWPSSQAAMPGRLLAAVLERVQREVRESGDVGLGRVDAEDAALVARSVAMVELGRSWRGVRASRVPAARFPARAERLPASGRRGPPAVGTQATGSRDRALVSARASARHRGRRERRPRSRARRRRPRRAATAPGMRVDAPRAGPGHDAPPGPSPNRAVSGRPSARAAQVHLGAERRPRCSTRRARRPGRPRRCRARWRARPRARRRAAPRAPRACAEVDRGQPVRQPRRAASRAREPASAGANGPTSAIAWPSLGEADAGHARRVGQLADHAHDRRRVDRARRRPRCRARRCRPPPARRAPGRRRAAPPPRA